MTRTDAQLRVRYLVPMSQGDTRTEPLRRVYDLGYADGFTSATERIHDLERALAEATARTAGVGP